MLSNYPAGVTGHEYQIAGGSEIDENLLVDECANVGEYLIMRVTKFGRYSLDELQGTGYRRVAAVLCTFQGGEVQGIVLDHSVFVWDCPSCGQENQLDVAERYEEPERDYEPEYWD